MRLLLLLNLLHSCCCCSFLFFSFCFLSCKESTSQRRSSKYGLRRKPKIDYSLFQGAGNHPLTQVECQWYKTPREQPFCLVLCPRSLFLIDLHAHLADTEVIGLLAGAWSTEDRVLVVEHAFPCEALDTGDNSVNVELCPASEVEVRQTIMGMGLRVVGWYHSHPHFRNDPSIVDLHNQSRYQQLFRDSSDRCSLP